MCFFMLSAEWLPLVISAVLPVQSLRFFSVLEFEFHLILVGGGAALIDAVLHSEFLRFTCRFTFPAPQDSIQLFAGRVVCSTNRCPVIF